MTTTTPEAAAVPTTPEAETDEQQPSTVQQGEPDEQRDTADEPQTDGKAGREAQKLRKRLRETETERDSLTTERDTLRRALVDAHLDRAMPAEAFWAAGHDPATLVRSDGTADLEAITAAISETRERFNIPGTPRPDPSQGLAPSREPRPRESWTNAFRTDG